eukprot:jgi/Botrbrau1/11969/Bobra.0115s0005.1
MLTLHPGLRILTVHPGRVPFMPQKLMRQYLEGRQTQSVRRCVMCMRFCDSISESVPSQGSCKTSLSRQEFHSNGVTVHVFLRRDLWECPLTRIVKDIMVKTGISQH